MIVPALVDEKVYAGVELEVGVVTGVTSAITGASTFSSFSSSSMAQEMTVRLKRDMRIMYKIFFILYFNTKSKILLVIRRTQNNNTNRFVLQENGNFTWRVSDCEEIRGVNLLPGRGVKDLKDLKDLKESSKFVYVVFT